MLNTDSLPFPGHVQVKITNEPNYNTFARGDFGGITEGR